MDKAKKKQLKKIVTWVLMAALVAGLAAMPLLAKKEVEADGPVASILSGKVEEGSIRTSLHGGGNLAVEDAENIRIPSGVKITEFLVRNGDRVTEGTPLAAVDKVSVMTAITSVKESMEYLEVEMRDAKNEKVDSTISAVAGGRVKKVYAQKGDSVQRIMLEHGALALLSLDGLMAVKIERKMELPTGQSVEVTLSDGTEVTGRVESNLSGEIVITVEDKGYAIGEKVTVLTNDGDRVGTGELYVHNAWTATAYSGTIQNVQAKEETKITSGSTLFTLTDTDFRGDLEYLSALHREYEALMQDLFNMYNSGTINAPCTGMVSGVDKDSAHLLSGMDGEWKITLLNHTEEDGFVAFAAQVTAVTDTALNLAIDPTLIYLDNLYDLAQIEVDPAAMTQMRNYPADTRVYLQNSTGSLVSTGLPNSGDRLLFVGDESGVLWVVNLELSVATLAADKTGVKLELLTSSGLGDLTGSGAATVVCDPEKGEDCPVGADGEHDSACIYACSKGSSCSGTERHYPACIKSCHYNKDTQTCPGTLHHKTDCIMSCQHVSTGNCGDKKESDPHYLDCVHACQKSDGTKDCTALKHWPGCIESCTHANSVDACSATDYHYTDCIKSCISSSTKNEPCPSSKHKAGCFFYGVKYYAEVAKVSAVGKDQLVVRWDASEASPYEVVKVGSSWAFASGSKFDAQNLVKEGTVSIGNPNAYKAGDVIFRVYGYKGDELISVDVVVYQRSSAGGAGFDMSAMAGMLGGMGGFGGMSGMAGMGGMSGMTSSSPVESDSLFDLNGSVLLTVTPETTASLSITLDEQDIAKVFIGQKAIVKVQALGKETFEAEVVEISNHGENNGGNSKFAVKLRFAKTHDMIDGMSATAILELDNHETVPVIPVAALAEQGSKTVVYTAVDSKTGELADPVTVTIGASDGENVQILDGLALGDTYYYSYYDILEVNTAA